MEILLSILRAVWFLVSNVATGIGLLCILVVARAAFFGEDDF